MFPRRIFVQDAPESEDIPQPKVYDKSRHYAGTRETRSQRKRRFTPSTCSIREPGTTLGEVRRRGMAEGSSYTVGGRLVLFTQFTHSSYRVHIVHHSCVLRSGSSGCPHTFQSTHSCLVGYSNPIWTDVAGRHFHRRRRRMPLMTPPPPRRRRRRQTGVPSRDRETRPRNRTVTNGRDPVQSWTREKPGVPSSSVPPFLVLSEES